MYLVTLLSVVACASSTITGDLFESQIDQTFGLSASHISPYMRTCVIEVVVASCLYLFIRYGVLWRVMCQEMWYIEFECLIKALGLVCICSFVCLSIFVFNVSFVWLFLFSYAFLWRKPVDLCVKGRDVASIIPRRSASAEPNSLTNAFRCPNCHHVCYVNTTCSPDDDDDGSVMTDGAQVVPSTEIDEKNCDLLSDDWHFHMREKYAKGRCFLNTVVKDDRPHLSGYSRLTYSELLHKIHLHGVEKSFDFVWFFSGDDMIHILDKTLYDPRALEALKDVVRVRTAIDFWNMPDKYLHFTIEGVKSDVPYGNSETRNDPVRWAFFFGIVWKILVFVYECSKDYKVVKTPRKKDDDFPFVDPYGPRWGGKVKGLDEDDDVDYEAERCAEYDDSPDDYRLSRKPWNRAGRKNLGPDLSEVQSPPTSESEVNCVGCLSDYVDDSTASSPFDDYSELETDKGVVLIPPEWEFDGADVLMPRRNRTEYESVNSDDDSTCSSDDNLLHFEFTNPSRFVNVLYLTILVFLKITSYFPYRFTVVLRYMWFVIVWYSLFGFNQLLVSGVPMFVLFCAFDWLFLDSKVRSSVFHSDLSEVYSKMHSLPPVKSGVAEIAPLDVVELNQDSYSNADSRDEEAVKQLLDRFDTPPSLRDSLAAAFSSKWMGSIIVALVTYTAATQACRKILESDSEQVKEEKIKHNRVVRGVAAAGFLTYLVTRIPKHYRVGLHAWFNDTQLSTLLTKSDDGKDAVVETLDEESIDKLGVFMEGLEAAQLVTNDKDAHNTYKVLGFLTCLPAIVCGVLPWSQVKETMEESSSSIRRNGNLVFGSINSFITTSTKVKACMTGGGWSSVFSENKASKLTRLLIVKKQIETGAWRKEGIDLKATTNEAFRIVERWKKELKIHPSRLLQEQILKMNEVGEVAMQFYSNQKHSHEPFSYCLYGMPGCGKSTMLPIIMQFVLTQLGIPKDEQFIAEWSPRAKYMADYVSPYHNGVIADDPHQISIEYAMPGFTPMDIVTQFVESAPVQIDGADLAEKKGRILSHSAYGFTSNKLYVVSGAADEGAFYRRWGLVILCALKAEYKNMYGALDRKKAEADDTMDTMLYRIGKFVTDGDNVRFVDAFPDEPWFDLTGLLARLEPEIKAHKKSVEHMAKTKNTMAEECNHGFPRKHCHHCIAGALAEKAGPLDFCVEASNPIQLTGVTALLSSLLVDKGVVSGEAMYALRSLADPEAMLQHKLLGITLVFLSLSHNFLFGEYFLWNVVVFADAVLWLVAGLWFVLLARFGHQVRRFVTWVTLVDPVNFQISRARFYANLPLPDWLFRDVRSHFQSLNTLSFLSGAVGIGLLYKLYKTVTSKQDGVVKITTVKDKEAEQVEPVVLQSQTADNMLANANKLSSQEWWSENDFKQTVKHLNAIGATKEHVLTAMSRAMVRVTVLGKSENARPRRMFGLQMNERVLGIPRHAFRTKRIDEAYKEYSVLVEFPEGRGKPRELIVAHDEIYYVPHGDFVFVLVRNKLPSVPHMAKFLPVAPSNGRQTGWWVQFDGLLPLKKFPVVVEKFTSWRYSAKDFCYDIARGGRFMTPKCLIEEGDCGKFVVSDNGGLVGCLVSGCDTFNVLQEVTLDDFAAAERRFMEKNAYNPPLEFKGIHQSKDIEVGIPPHPRSVINFPTQGTDIELLGITNQGHSSRNTMEVNPLAIEFERNMGVLPTGGPTSIRIRESFHAQVPLAAGNPIGFHSSVMNKTVELMCNRILNQSSLLRETMEKALIPNRPYSKTEFLNGIEGGVCCAVKLGKSAGDGKAKWEHVMHDLNGKRVLKDETNDLVNCAELELLHGNNPGFAHTLQTKIETKQVKIDGSGEPIARLFSVVHIAFNFIIGRWQGPLMDVVKLCPGLFFTAVGLDIMSPEWHNHINRFFHPKFADRCINYDVKKFDASMGPVLKNAEARLWITIAEACGWTQPDINMLKNVVDMSHSVMVKVDGAVMSLGQLFLSGVGPTAIGNGFRTILLLLYTFVKCAEDKGVELSEGDLDEFIAMSLGDDCLAAASKELADRTGWTPEKARVILDECGIHVTSPDKSEGIDYVHARDAEFLRSKPVYWKDMEMIVNARYPESIWKSLLYIESLDGIVGKNVSLCESALAQIGVHGRDMYDLYQNGGSLGNRKIEGIIPLFNRIGYPVSEILSRSYDEFLEQKRESDLEKYGDLVKSEPRFFEDNRWLEFVENYEKKPRYVPRLKRFDRFEHEFDKVSEDELHVKSEDVYDVRKPKLQNRGFCFLMFALICLNLAFLGVFSIAMLGSCSASVALYTKADDAVNIQSNQEGPEAAVESDTVPIESFAEEERDNMSTILEREFELITANITPGTNATYELYPYADALSNATMEGYLKHYLSFSAGMQFSIEVSVTPAHSGQLVLTFVPRHQYRSVSVLSSPIKEATLLQMPSCAVVLNGSVGRASLKVPFMHDHPMVKLKEQDLRDMGKLVLWPLNRVRHSFGSTVSVEVRVVAKFIDLRLGPMTTTVKGKDIDSPETDEKLSTRLTKFSAITAQIGSIGRNIPYLGTVSNMMSSVAGAAGSVLYQLGYAQPPVTQVVSVQQSILNNLANCNGPRPTEVLAVDVMQETIADAGHAGSGENWTNFDVLKQKWTYFSTVEVTPAALTNSIIRKIHVTPAICPTTQPMGSDTIRSSDVFVLSSCAMPFSKCTKWHGGTWIRFEFIGAPTTACKFLLFYDPTGSPNYDRIVNESAIIDFSPGLTVDVLVEYSSFKTVLNGVVSQSVMRHWSGDYDEDAHNGTLFLAIRNRPISGSTGNAYVAVNTYVKAHSDMQYFAPTEQFSNIFSPDISAVNPGGYVQCGLTSPPASVFAPACTPDCSPFNVGIDGCWSGPYSAPPPIDTDPPGANTVPPTGTTAPSVTVAPTPSEAPATMIPTTFAPTMGNITTTGATTTILGVPDTTTASMTTTTDNNQTTTTSGCDSIRSTESNVIGNLRLDGTQRHDNNSQIRDGTPASFTEGAVVRLQNGDTEIHIPTWVDDGTIDILLGTTSDLSQDTFSTSMPNISFTPEGNKMRITGTTGFSGFVNVYFTWSTSTLSYISNAEVSIPACGQWVTFHSDQLSGGRLVTVDGTTIDVNTASDPSQAMEFDVGLGEFLVLSPTTLPTGGVTYAIVYWQGNRMIGDSTSSYGRDLANQDGVPQWSGFRIVAEVIRLGADVYFTGEAGDPVKVFAVHQFVVPTARSEEINTHPGLVVKGDDFEGANPDHMQVTFGRKGNNDDIAHIVQGEHVLSLKTLSSRPRYVGAVLIETQMTSSGLAFGTVTMDLYNKPPSNSKTTVHDLCMRSCFAVRGGMTHTHSVMVDGIAEATVLISVGSNSRQMSNIEEGSAVIDTRVNPTNTVKCPYVEGKINLITRPSNDLVVESSRFKVISAYTTGPTKVWVHTWVSTAEDLEYLNYLGGARLRLA